MNRTKASQGASELTRVLARKDVLALAFGAMVGWGWIVMTGNWIQSAGSMGAILAFLIGGVAIVLVGLTYAELASAMPQVGGEHVYSYHALGHFASFLCTWAIVLGYMSVVSFEAVALPTVFENLFPGYAVGHLWTIAGWDVKATWVAVGVIGSVIMMAINYIGIRTAALVQKLVTVLILVVGVMFITGALFTGETVHMEPLFNVESGLVGGIMTVMIMVPFMFVGFDVIPQAAEEINLPFRDIGKVLMISVVLAVFWYALIILGTSLMLDPQALEASTLAVPDAMQAVFSAPWAGKLMVLAGIAGIITSWNAFYIGGSRAVYALAHAGMLPAFLGKLHPRYKTPSNAVIMICRVVPGAVLRASDAGVARRCRRAGHRHRVPVRGLVFPGDASQACRHAAPLQGALWQGGGHRRRASVAGNGEPLPAGQPLGAAADRVGRLRGLDAAGTGDVSLVASALWRGVQRSHDGARALR